MNSFHQSIEGDSTNLRELGFTAVRRESGILCGTLFMQDPGVPKFPNVHDLISFAHCDKTSAITIRRNGKRRKVSRGKLQTCQICQYEVKSRV
jgi:hypothetical protein